MLKRRKFTRKFKLKAAAEVAVRWKCKEGVIHPFCITIDKQAHDYIGHMYGEVNYIFVDEVRKLPMRLPEIYRVLTT